MCTRESSHVDGRTSQRWSQQPLKCKYHEFDLFGIYLLVLSRSRSVYREHLRENCRLDATPLSPDHPQWFRTGQATGRRVNTGPQSGGNTGQTKGFLALLTLPWRIQLDSRGTRGNCVASLRLRELCVYYRVNKRI